MRRPHQPPLPALSANIFGRSDAIFYPMATLYMLCIYLCLVRTQVCPSGYDFLTPSPSCPRWATGLYYRINATSLTLSAFPLTPPPPRCGRHKWMALYFVLLMATLATPFCPISLNFAYAAPPIPCSLLHSCVAFKRGESRSFGHADVE